MLNIIIAKSADITLKKPRFWYQAYDSVQEMSDIIHNWSQQYDFEMLLFAHIADEQDIKPYISAHTHIMDFDLALHNESKDSAH